MSYVDVLANDAVRNLVMPISVAQYHQYCAMDSGLLKTELIEGVIFRKVSKSPRHSYLVAKLYRILDANLSAEYVLRREDPLTLTDSEPEPDLAIVRGSLEDYIDKHPDFAELVIEIAISTIALDRQKAAIYAAANIPEYWLILPEQKKIEIYHDPLPIERRYKTTEIYAAEQTLNTICGPLNLADLLT